VITKPLTSGMIVNPQSLQHKRVLSIDLAAIMAGSGIRGQFEEKFKALLRDIEDEVRLTPLTFLTTTANWIHLGTGRQGM
jgi:hypothetical protein